MPPFDFSRDSRMLMSCLANCTVSVSLNGVSLAQFPGIFDEHAEAVNPFEAEKTMVKPLLTVEDANMTGIDSACTLEIRGKQFKFDGKPKPDGAGFTVVYLGQKK